MSRIQLALDVDDLETSVAFYTRLLGVEPTKRRPGYANFAVAEPPLKLVLLEHPGRGGGLNHLGVEVASSEQVSAETARLNAEGLLTDEETGTTCCWATQDKVWATGPDGERWEIYTVLADADVFGTSPAGLPAPSPSRHASPAEDADSENADHEDVDHGDARQHVTAAQAPTCCASSAAPACC